MGHASHFVAVERGVRRHGTLMAGDSQQHMDTMRASAPQEGLSQVGLDRIEQAQRLMPKMQAPIACVSGYGRRQVRQLAVAPPVAYAIHAHLMPSY
jgi:hypothetical protein